MRTAPEPVQGPQRNDPWGGDSERFGLRNRLLGRQSWKSCLQGGTAGRRPGKGCSSSRGWPAPSGEDLLAGRNAEGPRLVVLPASLWTSCPPFLGRATSVDSITQAHALRPLGGQRGHRQRRVQEERSHCVYCPPPCVSLCPPPCGLTTPAGFWEHCRLPTQGAVTASRCLQSWIIPHFLPAI